MPIDRGKPKSPQPTNQLRRGALSGVIKPPDQIIQNRKRWQEEVQAYWDLVREDIYSILGLRHIFIKEKQKKEQHKSFMDQHFGKRE